MVTIYAPFTKEQADSINEFQKSKYYHSFTCPVCRSPLIVTDGFLKCSKDPENHGYLQNWCHNFMADWSWKNDIREGKIEDLILMNAMEVSGISEQNIGEI